MVVRRERREKQRETVSRVTGRDLCFRKSRRTNCFELTTARAAAGPVTEIGSLSFEVDEDKTGTLIIFLFHER